MALACAAIRVVLVAGASAVWLTGKARVFGLVARPTATVAELLVVWFDWREKLRRQMHAELKDYLNQA